MTIVRNALPLLRCGRLRRLRHDVADDADVSATGLTARLVRSDGREERIELARWSSAIALGPRGLG